MLFNYILLFKLLNSFFSLSAPSLIRNCSNDVISTRVIKKQRKPRSVYSHTNLNLPLIEPSTVSQEGIKELDLKYNYSAFLDSKVNLQTLNSAFNFEEWLVGFTDGEGSFITTVRFQAIRGNRTSCYINSIFRLPQSIYNERILEFIQIQLGGIGNIVDAWANNPSNYVKVLQIQNKVDLSRTVMPIFYRYPLHTIKYYFFELFNLLLVEKNHERIRKYKALYDSLPANFVSPHSVMPTRSWIIGFIEAEGSFQLQRNRGYYKHVFAMGQLRDRHILEQIRLALNITSRVSPVNNEKGKPSEIRTESLESIKFIIKFCDGMMVGAKGFEFKLWKESFENNRTDHKKLQEVQLYMRILRERHKAQVHKRVLS